MNLRATVAQLQSEAREGQAGYIVLLARELAAGRRRRRLYEPVDGECGGGRIRRRRVVCPPINNTPTILLGPQSVPGDRVARARHRVR